MEEERADDMMIDIYQEEASQASFPRYLRQHTGTTQGQFVTYK